jgi:hypothetical protein
MVSTRPTRCTGILRNAYRLRTGRAKRPSWCCCTKPRRSTAPCCISPMRGPRLPQGGRLKLPTPQLSLRVCGLLRVTRPENPPLGPEDHPLRRPHFPAFPFARRGRVTDRCGIRHRCLAASGKPCAGLRRCSKCPRRGRFRRNMWLSVSLGRGRAAGAGLSRLAGRRLPGVWPAAAYA